MILWAAAIDLTYLAPLKNTCPDRSLSHREKEVAPRCDSPRPMAACVERPSGKPVVVGKFPQRRPALTVQGPGAIRLGPSAERKSSFFWESPGGQYPFGREAEPAGAEAPHSQRARPLPASHQRPPNPPSGDPP